ncbi:MAG TPA: hypothetical protein VLV50_11655 [Stellaceae bacterium]|nr:hypothetical protein [Stellaceae bacterium]
MSMVDERKHPLILALDVLVFLFTISEVVEGIFHIGLRLILPEAELQLVTLVLRAAAVWHAGRHL